MVTLDSSLCDGAESRKLLWLAVFREVLKSSDIDEDTNFFEAGGHSLLIPLLLSHYESLSGWQPPASLLFRFSSPRQLEAVSAELRSSAAEGSG